MQDQARTMLEEAVRRLLSEIATGDYRDGLKRRLTKHPAYVDALALLELNEVVRDAK